MIKIGINGFGRIGRILCRIASQSKNLRIVHINDIVEDVNNLAYLYNYDSTYNSPQDKASISHDRDKLVISDHAIRVTKHKVISDVDWQDADIVVDSSGVERNVREASRVAQEHEVSAVIVTHSPKSNIDKYIIFGLNERTLTAEDRVVSSSICDANAIAHPLKLIHDAYGIASGFVTTLHPWLSYQNLVDAPLASQSNPGHFWKDYSLGRSSTDTLIPKDTTAVTALQPILPNIADRLGAFSYRTPTAIVSSADITLRLQERVDEKSVLELFHQNYRDSKIIALNQESLVGVDYKGSTQSAIIDLQWIKVKDDLLKIILWYDNEWGYCSRVADLAHHIHKVQKNETQTRSTRNRKA